VSTLAPSSAIAGSGNLEMVVVGSNYNSKAVVVWNGAPLATTAVSSTVVQASIPASALTTAGVAQVKVANGQTSSNVANFTIVQAAGGPCDPPNYCAHTGIDLQPYSGVQNVPPLLNQSFLDPTFNRKIWRITDTTTAASGVGTGASFSPTWGSGFYPGVWNTTETLMLLNSGSGFTQMFAVNVANPNAPSVTPTACSYLDSPTTCFSGKVVVNGGTTAGQMFSGVSANVTYGWSQNAIDGNGALVKLDWTNTISSGGSIAPTRAVLFSPYAVGKCLGSQSYPGFSEPLYVDPADGYFWGQGLASGSGSLDILYKSGASDCKLLNTSVSPWTLSGDTTIGPNGSVTTEDENGNVIANAPACLVHGYFYDPITNSLFVDGSFSCGSVNNFFLDLTTLVLKQCSGHCGGHFFGIVNTGTQTGFMGGPDCYTGQQLSYWFMPFNLVTAKQEWAVMPSTGSTTCGNLDEHPNGQWTSGFPYLAAFGLYNSGGPAPPVTSLNALLPYEGEMMVLRCTDGSGTTCTFYRFVHNYTAAGGYDSSAGQYPWGVMTSFSPDHKWIIWSSNWLGNLGDQTASPPTTPCTSAAPSHCRYDTFMVYLAGGPGT